MPSLKYLLLFLIWAEESMIWNGSKVNSLFKILIPVWIFEYFSLLNSVRIWTQMLLLYMFSWSDGGQKVS